MTTRNRKRRVQIALSILRSGKARNNRVFDACFEMGDGFEVVCAVVGAAQADKELRDALVKLGAWEHWNTPKYKPQMTMKI